MIIIINHAKIDQEINIYMAKMAFLIIQNKLNIVLCFYLYQLQEVLGSTLWNSNFDSHVPLNFHSKSV